MSVAVRSILLGAALVAGYYALIFGYAARVRAERVEHVAWRFPLRGGSDYCADPLPNGAVVCSDNGTVYIVKDGTELGRFKAYDGNDLTRSYSPYEGYQWVGGTRDNLALVSVAKPPLDELALYAIECNGKVRWQVPMPPGEIVSWIACSPDSIYVLTYELTQGRSATDSHVHRYDLQGKLIYHITPASGAMQLAVTADNWAYVGDTTQSAIEARDPAGKLMWKTQGGGMMPVYSSYGGDQKLFYIDNAQKLRGVGRDGKELFATQLPARSHTRPHLLDEFRSMLNRDQYYPYYGGGYNACTFADGGDRIYYTDGELLLAFDTAGQRLWDRKLGGGIFAITADSKGRAYATLSSGGLTCLSADGKDLWRNSAIRDFRSAMSVAADDRIFVETSSELICLQP
jgi:hypothetical protein